MHCSCRLIQRLMLIQSLQCRGQRFSIDFQFLIRDLWQRFEKYFSILQSANPATGAPDKVAPLLSQVEPFQFFGRDGNMQFYAAFRLMNIHGRDFFRFIDDALGNRKPDGEILHVQRRRQHHGIVAAIVDESDGRFFRYTPGSSSDFDCSFEWRRRACGGDFRHKNQIPLIPTQVGAHLK